jgi:hypothetical protein
MEKAKHRQNTDEIIEHHLSQTDKLARINCPEKFSFVAPFFEVGLLLRQKVYES